MDACLKMIPSWSFCTFLFDSWQMKEALGFWTHLTKHNSEYNYKCLWCWHKEAALCYIYSMSRHWQQSGSSWIFHPDCCLREIDYIHPKLSHFPVHKNQTSPKPEPRLDPIYRSRELAFPARSVTHTQTQIWRPRVGSWFHLSDKNTLSLSTRNSKLNSDICACPTALDRHG